MSTEPAPEPRGEASHSSRPAPASALRFDDPLTARSADDSDAGWGEHSAAHGEEGAADLARFLREKPPHHL